MRKRGFTIIELLVVGSIIIVLFSIISIKSSGSSTRAKTTATSSNSQEIQSAKEAFYADTGYYPANNSDLTGTTGPTTVLTRTGTTVNLGTAVKGYNGPYLSSL